jgi:hypothetical protein
MREREGPAAERWEGEGLSGLKRSEYGLDHPVGIVQNIVVPKADHLPALSLEKGDTTGVRQICRMLTPVDFDYQCTSGAGKVDYLWADWVLPTEFVFLQSTIA